MPVRSACVRLSRRHAFTLIELLVVIAIIGTLVSLLLPALGMVREASRRSECLNHFHQIGVALKNYYTANDKFPVGCVQRRTLRLAWNCYLLPYLDEPSLFGKFHFDQPYNGAANHDATKAVLPVFLCPSTTRYSYDRNGNSTGDRNGNGKWDMGDQMGLTDYGGMFGAANIEPFMNGVMVWDKAVAEREITDGLQYTLIVAEDTGRGPSMDGEWANGENIFDVAGPINTQQDNEPWSDHPSGLNVLFCDGRALFVSEDMPLEVLEKLCTRAAGELVGPEDVNR